MFDTQLPYIGIFWCRHNVWLSEILVSLIFAFSLGFTMPKISQTTVYAMGCSFYRRIILTLCDVISCRHIFWETGTWQYKPKRQMIKCFCFVFYSIQRYYAAAWNKGPLVTASERVLCTYILLHFLLFSDADEIQDQCTHARDAGLICQPPYHRSGSGK